ncbi:MAG: hypothetical protein WC517_00950 [Patescibacteria group bacterium]
MILWLLALLWLLFSWRSANRILARSLALDKMTVSLLAVFLPIFILGPLANIFTAWFQLNNWTICLSLFLSWAGLFIVDKFLLAKEPPVSAEIEIERPGPFVFSNWLYLIFGLAAAGGFYLIARAVNGGYLTSPWEVLSDWLIAVVIILSAIIIYVIYCRKIPIAATLMMIMVFSLLIHSYLLVYQNGFGGDRFRHLGSEERLIQEREYQPTLLTDNLWLKTIGPLTYPQALTSPAKLSYGTMWSLEVIAAKLSGLSVFQVNRFLLPILWSIFLTVIIFALAFLLRPDKRLALLAAWLANSFYLFQYYGAQGLPAAYGLLWLAFYFIFLISHLKNPSRLKFWLLLIGLILMYFNYSLAFLLASLGFIFVLTLIKKKKLIYVLAPLAILGLVGLDYLSSLTVAFSISKIWPAWLVGNLLDFHALSRFGPLFGWRSELELLLAVGFFALLSVALAKIWQRQDPAWLLVALMAKIILVAYFLSYWFWDGEHSLSRRLTLFAVLFLVLILADAADRAIRGRKSLTAVGLALILFSALAYYSGPVLDLAVTAQDLDRARVIWPAIRDQKDSCVEEPLSVILALEYVSAKEFQEAVNIINCK